MNKEDKLILGTLAGVDLVLSPEHYEEYKGTLNKQLEEKDKEIDRLNNIINELENWLKQRYKKTEENSSRMKDITSLNREFYITVKNVQSDRKDILDKLKALKENNK